MGGPLYWAARPTCAISLMKTWAFRCVIPRGDATEAGWRSGSASDSHFPHPLQANVEILPQVGHDHIISHPTIRLCRTITRQNKTQCRNFLWNCLILSHEIPMPWSQIRVLLRPSQKCALYHFVKLVYIRLFQLLCRKTFLKVFKYLDQNTVASLSA
jgi:hypothetical protein